MMTDGERDEQTWTFECLLRGAPAANTRNGPVEVTQTAEGRS